MATLIIGSNTITNCAQVLMINGREVFRLRQPDDDDQLVADFDICDDAGRPLARTSHNRIVQALDGIVAKHGPKVSEVVDAKGRTLARAEQLPGDVVRLSGTFGVPGTVIDVGHDVLRMPHQGTISRCTFCGNGTAIEILIDGSIAFARPVAAARPGFRVTSVVRALPQKQRRPK